MADKWDSLLNVSTDEKPSWRQQRKAKKAQWQARNQRLEAERRRLHGQDGPGLAMVVIVLLLLAGIWLAAKHFATPHEEPKAKAKPAAVVTTPQSGATSLPSGQDQSHAASVIALQWLHTLIDSTPDQPRQIEQVLSRLESISSPELLSRLQQDPELQNLGQANQPLQIVDATRHGIDTSVFSRKPTYYLGYGIGLANQDRSLTKTIDIALGLEGKDGTYQVDQLVVLGEAGK